jgi:nucleotide-binding universal stress UspA family protein
MIRTILVPVSGSNTDDSVFATALAAARPLAAHLDFYHLRMSCGAAAPYVPHLDFAVGSGLVQGLSALTDRQQELSIDAKSHFTAFCDSNKLPEKREPGFSGQVTVSFTEESDEPRARLLHRARRNDLVVLGRKQHTDCLPPGLLEDLLLEGARPVLIAPEREIKSIVGTVMIGWNRSPASERAVIAALPLLKRARHVVAVAIDQLGNESDRCFDDLTAQLSWHGIKVDCRLLRDAKKDAASQLTSLGAQIGAEMIVIGGYGHGPLRESIFGGVSQALIEQAASPVFLMH